MFEDFYIYLLFIIFCEFLKYLPYLIMRGYVISGSVIQGAFIIDLTILCECLCWRAICQYRYCIFGMGDECAYVLFSYVIFEVADQAIMLCGC